MPKPDRSHDEARSRLETRLEALEAQRAPERSAVAGVFSGEGSRFLGEVVSGVLGGTGLGWFVDRLAHTQPLGLISGLLLGTGLSIFVAVRQASRTAKQSQAQAGPVPQVASGDDED